MSKNNKIREREITLGMGMGGSAVSGRGCLKTMTFKKLNFHNISFQLKLDDWDNNPDKHLLELGGFTTEHAQR